MGLFNRKGAGKTGAVFFVILALAVTVIAYYLIKKSGEITTDDAYITGRVHTIAAKIPGTIVKIYVDDNKSVKKGDLLVEIDSADYELKLNDAAAALESTTAMLLDAKAGVNTAEADVKVKDVILAQAKLDKARAEKLYSSGVLTLEKHEKALTAYDLALAELSASKEKAVKAEAQIKLIEASIKQKQALTDIAKLNLTYTKIYAPADGYVTGKNAETGNQIQPGQPLMAVVALDDIWLIANYKETQLKNVKPGQRVKVKVDSYSGHEFSGKVDSIMAGTGAAFSLFPPENALGNYVKVVQRVPVKIIFDKDTDKNHVLRVGMSCEPTIITSNE